VRVKIVALGQRAGAQPTDGPSGGVADSLDEAKAAFRAAWGRQRLLEKRTATRQS
jgi:hypothetical protein